MNRNYHCLLWMSRQNHAHHQRRQHFPELNSCFINKNQLFPRLPLAPKVSSSAPQQRDLTELADSPVHSAETASLFQTSIQHHCITATTFANSCSINCSRNTVTIVTPSELHCRPLFRCFKSCSKNNQSFEWGKLHQSRIAPAEVSPEIAPQISFPAL